MPLNKIKRWWQSTDVSNNDATVLTSVSFVPIEWRQRSELDLWLTRHYQSYGFCNFMISLWNKQIRRRCCAWSRCRLLRQIVYTIPCTGICESDGWISRQAIWFEHIASNQSRRLENIYLFPNLMSTVMTTVRYGEQRLPPHPISVILSSDSRQLRVCPVFEWRTNDNFWASFDFEIVLENKFCI